MSRNLEIVLLKFVQIPPWAEKQLNNWANQLTKKFGNFSRSGETQYYLITGSNTKRKHDYLKVFDVYVKMC